MLRVLDFLADQVVHRSAQAPRQPLVSIVLPTYSRRDSLREAIASVLEQTFQNLELLVIDDGSSDGSADVIADFQARDPRVVHVRHQSNCGLPALRVNEGIELAAGRYLAFQFDDDRWRPRALEALVSRARREGEPTLVVGRAEFCGGGMQFVLPVLPLNPAELNERNRFANNCVLLPRAAVDSLGMYDCHIGMRRLCDWDLWLRYLRRLPLAVVDEVLTDVRICCGGAIGMTVPWDRPLFRHLHQIPRDHLLTPARWRDYQVDSLRIGEVETVNPFRQRLYEQQIVPYYLKFRHRFPGIEGFSPTLLSHPRSVMYIGDLLDETPEIAFHPFDRLASSRAGLASYYQQVAQVEPDCLNETDEALFLRPVEDGAKRVLKHALAGTKPAAVYLDDQQLISEDHADPSSPARCRPLNPNLREMLSEADLVWVSTDRLAREVRRLNPRVVLHAHGLPSESLPEEIHPRDSRRPLRVGYVASTDRGEEFEFLWQAIQRISSEFKERLEFEFWGLNVGGLPPLDSPVTRRPLVRPYHVLLNHLKEAEFDVLLAPQLDSPNSNHRGGHSPYLQAAVAGALGVFSDVPQFASLPQPLTCLKAANTADGWYQALRTAAEIPAEQFDRIRVRLHQHVREEYTDQALLPRHTAAWRATEFHGKTRAARHPDGKPRVAFVLPSPAQPEDTMPWVTLLSAVRAFGAEPVAMLPETLRDAAGSHELCRCLDRNGIAMEWLALRSFAEPKGPWEYDDPSEREGFRNFLGRCRPALVHSLAFVPAVGRVCAEAGIPHVMTAGPLPEGLAWPKPDPNFRHCDLVISDSIQLAHRWGDLLGIERSCHREAIPASIEQWGVQRHLESIGVAAPASGSPRLLVCGTFQPCHRQWEAILAAHQLLQEGLSFTLALHGCRQTDPDYARRCETYLREQGLEDRITISPPPADLREILDTAQILLSPATLETFPAAVKAAMAVRCLVVATPVGGVPELVLDGQTGILCKESSVEELASGIRRALVLPEPQRRTILDCARRVARLEFQADRSTDDLLAAYNRALDSAAKRRLHTTPPLADSSSSVFDPPSPGAPETPSPSSGESPAPCTSAPPGGLPPGATVSEVGSAQGFVHLHRRVHYRLIPHGNHWAGMDVVLGTHHQRPRGRLRLEVTGPQGHRLRDVTVELSTIEDNQWAQFRFEPILHASGHEFQVSFSLLDTPPRTCVSLYESNRSESRFWRGLRRAGVPLSGNQLHCRMWYAQ